MIYLTIVFSHSEKARIRAHDILAEALDKAWERLREAKQALSELDATEVNVSLYFTVAIPMRSTYLACKSP